MPKSLSALLASFRIRVLVGLLGLLGGAILGLSGCSKDEGAKRPGAPAVKNEAVEVEAGGTSDPIASPAAVFGGALTTWGGEFPKSLNYWLEPTSTSAAVIGFLFEPLVSLHSTRNDPVGIVADTWSISPDKMTYTFSLNPKARWSDGKAVTAADFQFYYDVIMNPKNLAPAFRVSLQRFNRPEVVDSLTLKVVAKEAHWANFWEAAGLVALPKHAWEGKDFNQIHFDFPVVSGPYRVADLKKDRSITLERRGDWWGRGKRYNQHKYNFDRIRYRFMADRLKVLEAFKKGEFDLYAVYTSSLWAEKTKFDEVLKNQVVRQRIFNQEPKAYQGMAINLRRPLFKDVRVREALSHLLNRELMNEKLMFNEYFLLNSYFPDLYPDNLNPDAPLRKYDPEKARKLLAEAGWKVGGDGILMKDGKRFSVVIPHSGPDLRHLNVYVEDLKKVGIDAKIDVLSFSTLQKRIDNHEFDIYWINTGAGRLRDPEPAWHSKLADQVATSNYAGVKDAYIDSLIEVQKTEMDLDKRNEILKRIDKRLNEIIPFVLMWQSANHRLLYWNRFGTPKSVLDKFGREEAAPVYWWASAEKEKALDAAKGKGGSLSAEPAEVHYQGE